MEYKKLLCDWRDPFEKILSENYALGWRVISSGFTPMNEHINNSWWAVMEREAKT